MGGGEGNPISREYRVIVTGFGPFDQAPHGSEAPNPAGEIAAIMPASISADHALNSSGVDIKLLTNEMKESWTRMDVSYGKTRNAIDEMYAQYGDAVDLWIHLGQAPTMFYSCERRAYSQDFSSSWWGNGHTYYSIPDNVDQTVHDLGPNRWSSVPPGLNTDLDVDRLIPEANAAYQAYRIAHYRGLPILEIRSHVEAGDAMCGFAYYESMAHCVLRGKKRHVLFCHVPPDLDELSLQRGRDAIMAIICASVSSLVAEARNPMDDQLERQWKFLNEH